MLKRTVAAIAALALSCAPVAANQASLWSPTTGTVSGLNLTNTYNAGLDSLASCNSGASPPANTLAGPPNKGQCWLNTSVSPNQVEVYDGTQWLVVGSLDSTNHWWEPPIGGGSGSLAAASSMNLGAVPYSYLSITGTASISSFGSSAPIGSIKVLKFVSAGSTLVYNSAAIILPTSANITTAAGDVALAVQISSGVWQVFYSPISGGNLLSSNAVPTGAVMAFNLSSCPTGWIAANGTSGTANMLGTVARGYDPSNTRDPAGSSQSIGSYESDTFQTHTHSSPSGTNYLVSPGVSAVGGSGSYTTLTTSGSTGSPNSGTPGAETRAKSTILLYCQKT